MTTIPRYFGFTDFAPVIPQLYWDVYSNEQRMKAICEQLCKVISYADMLGINVEEIRELLNDIQEGKLDPIINEAIAQWFEDNEPEIMAEIENLQTQIGEGFDFGHTVKDVTDFLRENLFILMNTVGNYTVDNTVEQNINRVDDYGKETRELLRKHDYSEPNFRCVGRFIAGSDSNVSAQAGCVFEQNGFLYWAQLINSTVANQDRLVIVSVESNTVVSDTLMEFGHGYTLSYNPTRKLLMTENSEVSPMMLIFIDVSNVANPYVISSYSVSSPIDNPCWYDADHIVGFTANRTLSVYTMDMSELVKTYETDFYNQFYFGQGWTFQSVCYSADEKRFYIATTHADGVIIADEDEDNNIVTMIDFIATKPYYGFVYMRELEFACKLDDKLYINTYDSIDTVLVPALLVWDMVNGTIPEENSWNVQPNTGNLGFAVNFETGTLIPNTSGNSKLKLAGDALNYARAAGSTGRTYITFETDYPYRFGLRGQKVAVNVANTTDDFTIHGIYLSSADLLVQAGSNLKVEPSTNPSGSTYVGIYARSGSFITFEQASVPDIVNTDGFSQTYMLYAEESQVNMARVTQALTNSWIRWSEVICALKTQINLYTRVAFNLVESS